MKSKQFMRDAVRRGFSLVLALVMVMAMLPAGILQANAEEEETKVYLKPGSQWDKDNARFAAYFYDNTQDPVAEEWVDLTDEDEDGYYVCVLPEDLTQVIFCRMNGETTENNWESKWNQTGDLTLPTDGKNCYEIPEDDDAWDPESLTDELWVTYEPETEPEPEPEPEKQDYYLVGHINGADYGCEGDYANLGEYKFVDGKLTATFTQDSYVFVKTGDNSHWYLAESFDASATSAVLIENKSEKLFVPGNKEVTFTLVENDDGSLSLSYTVATEPEPEPEPEKQDYYLIGYINGADYGCEGDYANLGEYKFVDGKLTATFTLDSYVFVKTGDNSNWYMADAYCTDTSVVLKNTSAGTSQKLFVPGNKELTFTLVENADGTLTLSYTVKEEGGEEPTPEVYTYTIHFEKPEDWGTNVNIYTWNGSYNPTGSWPGTAVSANGNNEGWYDAEFTADAASLCVMFNDGTNQTADNMTVNVQEGLTVEAWVSNDTVTYEAPEGWQTQSAATYVVAGDGALCGKNWDAADAANQMTLNTETGKYEKVYTNVAAGKYSIKVTDGTWENSWGDNGQNFTFTVSEACDVTVVFDPEAKTVEVKGDHAAKVSELEVSFISAVGNGSGNWLGGISWDPANAANKMTETSEKIYEITYTAVPKGSSYEFKFSANGTWADSWGGSFTESGAEAEAVYNGTNISLTIPYDAADVTLKLDLTNFNYTDKSGAKFTVTITEVEGAVQPVTYTLHYANPDNWETVNAYAWYGDQKPLGEWPGAEAAANAENPTWYDVELKDLETASLSFIFNGGDGQTADLSVTAPENATEVEVWVSGKTAADVSTAAPEGWVEKPQVTVHFLNSNYWANLHAYVWLDGDAALPGYESYKSWPGQPVPENAEKSGWYDLVVKTDRAEGFNFIFNSSGAQTADLATGALSTTEDTELWVVDGQVLTEAPGEWSGTYTYQITYHYHNTGDWQTVNAKFGQGDSWDPIPGFEDYKNNEFGGAMAANSHNAGWNTIEFVLTSTEKDVSVNGLFNNGSWGDGNQTGNWTLGGDPARQGYVALKSGSNTFWYDVDSKGQAVISTTAPDSWIDPDRKAYVPGTFPGNSWDAASNQMTFDPELGLFVYTFEDVPAANYEYKIAINGSWNENYGLNGDANGSNIPVAVPETMDVTVYYNDRSHKSVTSVDYVFADITLAGTGIPEGTKLTDKDLSGIYSAAVDLPQGTYEDITLTYQGETYSFVPFELTKTDPVTFYFDPATGIYYHDGSDQKVGEEAIFFDSKDVAYKSPFGAVEQNTDVTFTLDTGDDITQVKLIVKGVGSFEMKQPEAVPFELGVRKWTCTVQFPKIGEYDYYFAISNGSDMKVYGDDDGNYGTGKVSDLNGVMPYDLVVYKKGFETPDWMKNAVIYQIFPDRFFDGDPSNNRDQIWSRGDVDYEYIEDWYTLPENPEQMSLNPGAYPSNAHKGDGEWSNEIYGGDLDGITQKIGYLKALGVNVIYLNPVFSSISSHRYDAVDYTEIDPILGTLGDFTELVSVAEANGMHIVLDGVFNHVSDDSIYFDRYYKFLGTSEKIGAYPYWAYVYDYMAEKNAELEAAEAAAKKYFTDNYGITDYSYTEWFKVNQTTMAGTVDSIGLRAGKEVYSYEGWWGYDSMPVIYATNGSEYQTGNWASEIISGSGSVAQYWISKGSDGWRLDVANEVSDETWQRFRSSVKGLSSDAVIIGEIWDDATKYLKGDMYDSVMNYIFRGAVTGYAKGGSAQDAINTLERIRERYPEEAFYAMMNLVGSHDTTRILSYLDGIDDDRNQKDPASAFPTYANTSATAKARQYLVAFLQFTYPGAPTIYYGDEIGMVGADDPDDRRAMEWGQGSEELVKWYAKLAAIRAAYPELRTGSIDMLEIDDQALLGFTRGDGETPIIVVANNSGSAKRYDVEGEYVDLVTGAAYTGSVPARRGVILVPSGSEKTISVNSAALAPAYDASYTVNAANRTESAVAHDCDRTQIGKELINKKEATCTEKGYSGDLVCKGCWEIVTKGEETPMLEHDYQFTKRVEPTCTEEGYDLHTCANCTATKKDNATEAKGHGKTELKNAKKATCTEEGYTGDKVCKICGEIVEKGKPIARLDHKYRNGVCKVCSAKDPDYKPGSSWLPNTGDSFQLTLFVGIMVVAAAGIVVMIIVGRKHRKK